MRVAAAVLLLALLAAPAQAADRAVVIMHHPMADPDPFGVPFGGGDTFTARYAAPASIGGVFPFPTLVVDGIASVYGEPNPNVPYEGTLENYTATVERRMTQDAPLAISLRAWLQGPDLLVNASLLPLAPLADPSGTASFHAWAAVTEDHIAYTAPDPRASNGISDQRFTVRGLHDLGPVDLAPGNRIGLATAFAIPANWHRDQLRIAIWVQAGGSGGRFAPHEVLQATSAAVDGIDVTQTAKAPLVELYSATWCPPCLYGDLAVEQLAIRYANATSSVEPSREGYFRAPGPYHGVGARLLHLGEPMAGAEWVLLAAAMAVAGAIVVAARDVRKPSVQAGRLGSWLLGGAAVAVTGTFLFLIGRFLAVDLTYQSVLFYTRADVEWPWRVAGAWAGREGSLLLWTVMLACVTALFAWRSRTVHADLVTARARSWTRLVLASGLLLFILAVLADSPFSPTSPDLLNSALRGNGLSPTLKSGFILIHPPLMFLAYGLAAVPAASAIGHVASGTGKWSTVAMAWARSGWLVMTFALGLGAMWAYYTLGFGGYFAWDPVEVANLLPWLAFTVYLHAQLHHRRHGSYARVGPLLAILPFMLTVFSTISTRSGLWVSVHAFTDPTNRFNPDAAGRFLDILAADPSLGFHVAMFLTTLAVFLALWARRLARDTGRMNALSWSIAAVFGVYAAYVICAPTSAFSLLLEGAHRATGSTGYGLLLLGFAAVAVAAAPALFEPQVLGAAVEVPRMAKKRSVYAACVEFLQAFVKGITLRTLNAYAVLVLGMALLVLFLFHMMAANGWSTAFYEARFPYLAAPVLLGLIVLQAHQVHGRRRSLWIAVAALLAGSVAQWMFVGHRGGPFLLVLSAALVAVSLDRVRRAAWVPGASRRTRMADLLLWLAALADVLFWVTPPAINIGGGSLHVPFLVTLPIIAIALAALAWATWSMVGGPSRGSGSLHLLVGALAGFYVAAPLAALSWWLRRRQTTVSPPDGKARARLGQVGLYGVHLAMAIAVLGYAGTTYYKTTADAEPHLGDALTIGGQTVTFDGAASGPPGPLDTIAPHFTVRSGAAVQGDVEGRLHWEEVAQAHYPTPATLHRWNGDLYVDVEAVHIAPGATCLGPGHPDGAWIEAYKAGSPSRACSGDPIDQVRVHAVDLPGLGILWLALLLLVLHMGFLLFCDAGPQRIPI
ncbi:MAG: cytochrome c biogenesis protein CcsA [bacterium]